MALLLYETAKRRIPVWRVTGLANALEMTAEELIGAETKANKKRGPTPKVRRQIEQIERLPRNRQQFVSQVLEQLLTAEKV